MLSLPFNPYIVSLREEPIIISSLLFPLQVAAIHVIMLSSIDEEPISFASKTFNVPNEFWVKYGKPVIQRIRQAIAMRTAPLVLVPSTVEALILRINICAI